MVIVLRGRMMTCKRGVPSGSSPVRMRLNLLQSLPNRLSVGVMVVPLTILIALLGREGEMSRANQPARVGLDSGTDMNRLSTYELKRSNPPSLRGPGNRMNRRARKPGLQVMAGPIV